MCLNRHGFNGLVATIIRFFNLLRLDECGLCVWAEVLDHSLGDQGKCTDNTKWKQHIKCCAGEINPEITKRSLLHAVQCPE